MRSIDRLIGEGIGDGVQRTGNVRGGPSIEAGERLAASCPERDQLRVLDPPPTRQLFDDQLRIEEEMDLAGAELTGELEGTDDARVLGDVVRLDAEVVRDRGVGDGARVSRVRSRKVEEGRPERGRPGVPARGSVGPDDEPASSGDRRFP